MNNLFTKGQVILFQGDSITDCDRDRENDSKLGNGYAAKVASIYETLYPETPLVFINRAVGGDRSRNLLERYEQDIKAVKPDFISILVGINDTWRRYDQNDPTTAEVFENNYETLLLKIKQDLPDAKIMMIEPYVLHTLEDRAAWHEDLDPKIQVVRKLAKKYADYFMPLDGILQRYLVEGYQEHDISEDGVHPSETGHGMIAKEYMKTLGLV